VTREEFAIQMDRLKSVYGDRFYPMERIAMMFEQLGESHVEHLSKTVSRVICEQMNPPTLTKIKEALVLVRQEYQLDDPLDDMRKSLASGRFNTCSRCYGFGTVEIRKKSENLKYAYARICTCGAGVEAQRLPENRRLRRWDDDPDVLHHGSPKYYDDFSEGLAR